MLNVRNGFPVRLLAVAAFVAAPAFHGAIAADDGDEKAATPVLDLNARLQQTLNAKLNGQIENSETIPEDKLSGDLSERVDEQQAAAAEALEEQASTLTSAKRGEEEKDQEEEKEAAKAVSR
ncbi:MAG TPA: hypothetical protein VF275_07735 [Gammaproteobacteria bacterium]